MGRQRRANANGPLDGVGEFAGMSGSEHDHRDGGIASNHAGGAEADRGVRIEDLTGRLVFLGHHRNGGVVVDPRSGEDRRE